MTILVSIVVILTSIDPILEKYVHLQGQYLQAILMYFKTCGISLLWNWFLKLILRENLFKIASKLTSIVTILAGDSIFWVFAQYLCVLPQYLQVLSQCLRVLSGWMHPNLGQLPLGCFEPIYSWVWPKPIPSFGYNSDNRHF